MTRTNIKRLRALAEVLREADRVPFFRRIFTMSTWGFSLSSDTADAECGTPGCSLGHYASRIDVQRVFILNNRGKVETKSGHALESETAHHFGIDHLQFSQLFGSEGCGNAKRPGSAAKYVDRFTDKLEHTHGLA